MICIYQLFIMFVGNNTRRLVHGGGPNRLKEKVQLQEVKEKTMVIPKVEKEDTINIGHLDQDHIDIGIKFMLI